MPESLIEVNTRTVLDISKEIEKLSSTMRTTFNTIAAKDKELHLKNLDENKKEFDTQLKIISSAKPEPIKPVVQAPQLIEAPIPEQTIQKPEEEEEEQQTTGVPGTGLPGGGIIPYVAPGAITPIITGRYGEQRPSGTHGGSDLAVPEGTPLRAISDGRIVDKGFDSGGWGNFIVYVDNKGIYHLYGHIQNGARGPGAIKKGDIIANVGMTGRVTGPHLHWETGTGWNGGVLTGKFDPLNRYSMNAPFSTAREEEKPKPKVEPATQKKEVQNLSTTGTNQAKAIIINQSQSQPSSQSYSGENTLQAGLSLNNNRSSISRDQLIFATV